QRRRPGRVPREPGHFVDGADPLDAGRARRGVLSAGERTRSRGTGRGAGSYPPVIYVLSQDQLPSGSFSHEFVGDDHGGVGVSVILTDAGPDQGPSLPTPPYTEIP